MARIAGFSQMMRHRHRPRTESGVWHHTGKLKGETGRRRAESLDELERARWTRSTLANKGGSDRNHLRSNMAGSYLPFKGLRASLAVPVWSYAKGVASRFLVAFLNPIASFLQATASDPTSPAPVPATLPRTSRSAKDPDRPNAVD
ncbi:hypothetical protein TARUN_7594 [Trichoderma arundinaceum]|uniref:Uncharacterized protein n=1 Tax=Trichoderma arundinaceum TaxID=490622 RepID=A0A395NFB3_TRIAR|nr:hypothetical protein TARUN_7594 [Trichoderma arundinaceum]